MTFPLLESSNAMFSLSQDAQGHAPNLFTLCGGTHGRSESYHKLFVTKNGVTGEGSVPVAAGSGPEAASASAAIRAVIRRETSLAVAGSGPDSAPAAGSALAEVSQAFPAAVEAVAVVAG